MNELQMIFNICKELQNTSSIIEKQKILKRNENNKLFKEVLKFLLDNQIVTGISKKKIDKKINYAETDDLKTWIFDIRNLLSYLKEHNTGTDKDIVYCQNFLIYDYELNEFVKSIITKSLKLGIDVKTVNKVYGKTFIPVLNVMLGTSIEKCKIPDGSTIYISQKLNGSRCFYYKGKLYTRQGKVYTGCEHIIKDIETLLVEKDYVVDGELILKDKTLSDSEAFQKGVGIANSDKENKDELKLIIFDIIPTQEFENGQSILYYQSRKKQLKELQIIIEKMNLNNVEVVPMFYEGADLNKIWEWLDYAEQHDMEGIMVNLNSPYECKRTKNLIKVKKFYDIDLRCVSINEAISGKYKGTLGSITCKFKNYFVDVGSGFTDEQRNYYFNNPNEIIGKIVTVKYKEETKNKNGGASLQFPVVQCIRTDKDIADDEVE